MKFVEPSNSILFLSHDVESGSDITPCNKIDRPVVLGYATLHNSVYSNTPSIIVNAKKTVTSNKTSHSYESGRLTAIVTSNDVSHGFRKLERCYKYI